MQALTTRSPDCATPPTGLEPALPLPVARRQVPDLTRVPANAQSRAFKTPTRSSLPSMRLTKVKEVTAAVSTTITAME